MKVRELIKLIDQLDDEAPRYDEPPTAGDVSYVPFVELVEMVSDGRCVAISRALLREISATLHSEFDATKD